MNINYEHYKVFYYAARYGSFTKAANVLYSNQPNISRTISLLEAQLGCRLFTRTRQGVTLTPEGEILYSHLEIAHQHIETAEAELTKNRRMEAGSISIGATEIALNLFLLDKLQAFRNRYPEIRFRITNHTALQSIAALDQGQVDLSVTTRPENLENHFSAISLLPYREVMVCGSNYAFLSEKEYSIHDLLSYPLIMLSRSSQSYWLYSSWYQKHGLEMHVDTEAATADQLIPLVSHNLGLAFIAEDLAKEALEKKEIYRVKLKEETPEREIALISDKRKTPSIASRAFMDFLQ